MDLVTAAEQQINRILVELEQHTDCVVKGIELQSIEMTTLESKGRRFACGVKIELERLPGHQWNLST